MQERWDSPWRFLIWKNTMCTNLAPDPLTPSCLSRFDNTCNLAQALYQKKLRQSSKLQQSLHYVDVDAFKPCALQLSYLCIALLMVRMRTEVTHEPSLIADGNIVTGVKVLFSAFWGEALPCFHLHTTSIHPNALHIPLLHSASLKLLHNNCKFYSAQIRLFPLTQKQTDC